MKKSSGTAATGISSPLGPISFITASLSGDTGHPVKASTAVPSATVSAVRADARQ